MIGLSDGRTVSCGVTIKSLFVALHALKYNIIIMKLDESSALSVYFFMFLRKSIEFNTTELINT